MSAPGKDVDCVSLSFVPMFLENEPIEINIKIIWKSRGCFYGYTNR